MYLDTWHHCLAFRLRAVSRFYSPVSLDAIHHGPFAACETLNVTGKQGSARWVGGNVEVCSKEGGGEV